MPTPEPCLDTSLTAFAQLCALRLQARRCLLTLLSTNVEYVLTESTRTMSLLYDSVEDVKDKAWIGTGSFLCDEGINASALDSWRHARRPRELPTDNDFYYTEGLSPHSCIISDVRENTQFSNKLFALRAPSARFYVSVPLRGAQGSVIGSVTILDDKPRYGISTNEVAFIEDVADTVMAHLDATVVRSARQRSERLIQGLGLFNNGKDSLRDWWIQQEESQRPSAGRYTTNDMTTTEKSARIDAEFGVQEQPPDNTNREASERTNSMDSNVQQLGVSWATRDNDIAAADRDTQHVSGMDHDQRPSKDLLELPSFVGEDAKSASETPTRLPGPQRRTKPKPKTTIADGFDLALASERAYARASNLMREALSADGVVFVDASVASLRRFDSESDAPATSCNSANTLTSETDDSDDSTSESSQCRTRGFSTRTKASVDGFKASDHQFQLPKSTLSRLVKRYPHGHVSNFEETGGLHSSSGDEGEGTTESSNSKRKRTRRPKDAERLGKVMVGARTIAFYPLRDETHGKWRSCVFVWNASPLRYFDQTEDITYLSAWSHSLIAELSRLETIAADKAKGTFISSISHELRSPLHGILAGVDFLQESELSAFQKEMAHTIGMAGRTLLDTVNHVLDYSKISEFTRAQKRRRLGPDATQYQLVSTADQNSRFRTDLVQLTEEVVESVVSSHRFRHFPIYTASAQENTLKQQALRPTYEPIDISIATEFACPDDWLVEVKPGAWTRIITNIVGNALKYTRKGSISIRIKAQELQPDADGEKCSIQLTVEDTGIGMSKQFLNNDVFTPFKQEDAYSPGTGLGLSIVKSLAMELDADLRILSELNEGTCIALTFNASFAHKSSQNVDLQPTETLSRGLQKYGIGRFHLLRPDVVESNDDFAPQSVEHTVLRVAKDWLGCECSCGPIIPSCVDSVICAITEGDLVRWAEHTPGNLSAALSNLAVEHTRLLVLAQSIESVRLRPALGESPIRLVFVHQPIGPRKLLRAITSEHDPRTHLHHEAPPEYRKSQVSPPSIETENIPLQEAKLSPALPLAQSSPAANQSVGTSKEVPSLPLSGSEPQPVIEGSSAHQRGSVLLVEDNEINMKFLVALIRKLKLDFQCAVNGREALEAYRATPGAFFLILMDMQMPIMDGFAATAKIREEEKRGRHPRTSIVALTGVTNADARENAFNNGVDEYFAKPVRMNELRSLVGSLRRE
ncbi:hypothetical protein K431DRAFT_292738 [Polychaeton citri CBS 116435]|uniref:histidine kinase n=1 Tax=Polychaeton citri CBS 116435 TaxID=1314669 RepID=A0A9P4QEH6_9PEZI|nr:hypothetical protein K431DRAFT_292738 [Polychaeton citri CBS 116435]